MMITVQMSKITILVEVLIVTNIPMSAYIFIKVPLSLHVVITAPLHLRRLLNEFTDVAHGHLQDLHSIHLRLD